LDQCSKKGSPEQFSLLSSISRTAGLSAVQMAVQYLKPEEHENMLMRQRKHQRQGHYSKKRLIFTIIGVLLLVGGATLLWILNLLGIVSGPWSSVLPVVFTVLGVVFTLLQLLLPFFESPKNSVDSNLVESGRERSKQPHIQVEGVDLGIDGQTGALIIYAKKSKLGESVDLYRNHVRPLRHSTTNIVTYAVDNQTVFAAIFPYLEPGDYIACEVSGCCRTKITVLPDQISKIEWRGTGIR
jgi:hypothetical protein